MDGIWDHNVKQSKLDKTHKDNYNILPLLVYVLSIEGDHETEEKILQE